MYDLSKGMYLLQHEAQTADLENEQGEPGNAANVKLNRQNQDNTHNIFSNIVKIVKRNLVIIIFINTHLPD